MKNMPQTSACMFSRPYYRRRDSRSVFKNISEKTCHQLKQKITKKRQKEKASI